MNLRIASLLAALIFSPPTKPTGNLSGRWTLTLTPGARRGMAKEELTCVFNQNHENLLVNCGKVNNWMFGGARSGKFVFRTDLENLSMTFSGQLDPAGTSLDGIWFLNIPSGSFTQPAEPYTRNGTFKGARGTR
jgi:hypothetical protein